ncbi:MAG: monovalent cation/H(+) antiporter subunit G [Proteobacteria bacterium]|nr:monovalent cation/H(+) antiporter subunit G [Pseudomonadota bacterium]MBU1710945.1 monovalent cation/H(+) antiporter subunit G [Pseudomonadota bacterium]
MGIILIILGLPFFLSGSIGLIRLPDIYNRLHALTKADNVGLGFILLGLTLQADNLTSLFKLFFIWILVLIASSASCHLIARSAIRKGIKPWSRQ